MTPTIHGMNATELVSYYQRELEKSASLSPAPFWWVDSGWLDWGTFLREGTVGW